MRHWIGAFLLALSLSLGLSIQATRAADQNRLTIGISQYPSTLHPAFDSMLAKSYIIAMARRPITVYDQTWQPTCLLCTDLPSLENGTVVFETAENGQDGMAVTYTLDPDAVWGDGTPLTTQDIVFSVAVGKDPASGIDNAELYRRIERVSVQDDKTFTLHMNKRTCAYDSLSGLSVLPKHIEQPIFEEGAAEYRRRTAYDTDATNPGLWYGPYKIARVTQGQSVLLDRNPNWWGPVPYFNEIEVRAIENTAALSANLRSGDVDMIAGELGLTVDQALSFEKSYGEAYQIVYKSGLIYEHIDLNLDNPILQDRRVRQALLAAIDRDQISARLFQGRQPPAHSNVNPLDSWHYDAVPQTAFDPGRAAALLDEAGWTRQGNSTRMKNGAPLSLVIQTTAGNKSRELVQQVLQDQWRAVGIDVSIDNEPPRVLFGETIAKRQFPAMAMFAWLSAPESVPRTTLHSQEIPTEENAWAGQNYTGYSNPEMDRIIDSLETECADEDQRRLWSEMQVLYATDLPALPLYFRANPFVMPLGLQGVRPTGHQFPSTLWVEEWRMSE